MITASTLGRFEVSADTTVVPMVPDAGEDATDDGAAAGAPHDCIAMCSIVAKVGSGVVAVLAALYPGRCCSSSVTVIIRFLDLMTAVVVFVAAGLDFAWVL
jgi:hypothetical protein